MKGRYVELERLGSESRETRRPVAEHLVGTACGVGVSLFVHGVRCYIVDRTALIQIAIAVVLRTPLTVWRVSSAPGFGPSVVV